MKKEKKKMQMRTSTLLIALLLFSIILPLTHAIGVTPARKVVEFQPNLETTITQNIINNDHRDLKAVIYARGELEPNIKILDSLVPMQADQERAEFRYEVNLPETLNPPGVHSAEIVVMELPNEFATEEGAGISAVGSVVSELYVRVPFPDKYAEAKLVIETAGQDEPVRFIIPIFNYGSEKIAQAKAHIDILGATYEKIGEVDTETISLNVKDQGKLVAHWIDNEINPGVYYAKGLVEYDGERIEVDGTFKLGDLAIEIIELKADKFRLGSIAAIDLILENKWNTQIKEIYAVMTAIDEEGTKYEKTKTTSINLDAFARGKLTAYWDTRDLPVGYYDLNIELHYEGKTNVKIIKANVNIDSLTTDYTPVGRAVVGAPSKSRDTMLYALVLLLILVNIGWFVYFIKSKKK